MFTCFYVSLQPLVAVSGVLQFFFMAYARRIYRLTYCKNSVEGTDMIGKIMLNIIFIMGSFIFLLGLMLFSSYSNNFNLSLFYVIPFLITIVMIVIPEWIKYNENK